MKITDEVMALIAEHGLSGGQDDGGGGGGLDYFPFGGFLPPTAPTLPTGADPVMTMQMGYPVDAQGNPVGDTSGGNQAGGAPAPTPTTTTGPPWWNVSPGGGQGGGPPGIPSFGTSNASTGAYMGQFDPLRMQMLLATQAGQRQLADIYGQQALKQIGAKGGIEEALANIQGGWGLKDVQAQTLPALMGATLAGQKWSTMAPYITGLLGQFMGGGGAGGGGGGVGGGGGGYLNPSLQATGVPPVNVATSVMSPALANALGMQNVYSGNIGALTTAAGGAQGPGAGNTSLAAQIGNTAAAQNQAAQQAAQTGFANQLAQANAQQALGAGQVGAQQQANIQRAGLGMLGAGTQAGGGLQNFITRMAGGR